MDELVIVECRDDYAVTFRKYLRNFSRDPNRYSRVLFTRTLEEQLDLHKRLVAFNYEIDIYIVEHEEEFRELFTKEKIKAMI